ncbi:MAG: serine hydrolase [Lachnospiraceae bacterium]|nr:serine hydrolase [Lachnospiraceae bacterium]
MAKGYRNNYSEAWDQIPAERQRPARPTGRKRRRKRRRHGAGITVAVFVPVIMVLIAACFLLWQQLPHPKKDLIGTWRTGTELADTASERAGEWLRTAALGSQIRLSEHFRDREQFRVFSDLTLSDNGAFSLSLDTDSYRQAQSSAVSALAGALVELIGRRELALGRDEAYASPEAVKEAFRGATALSVEEYLTIYGPALIDPLSDLQQSDRQGGFSMDVDGSRLIWDGSASSGYVLNGDVLALTGGAFPFYGADTAPDATAVFFRKTAAGKEEPVEQGSLKGFFRAHPLKLTAHAKNFRIVENMTAKTGAEDAVTVKAIHFDYRNNRYLSLRDLAGALKETAREFSLSISGSSIIIETNGTYEPAGGENDPFDTEGDDIFSAGDLKANDITIDKRNVKYFTFLGKNTEGKADCFINFMDFCLLFDMNAQMEDGVLMLDASTRPLEIDMASLRAAGFYDEMRSGLCGDATTGEIFDSWRADLAIPIASTTKLMSYAVIMDAVTAGEITLNDDVTISKEAADLSQGPDRMIPMTEGQVTNVRELLQGMLIASSNECAFALAEHVAGSETAFVERMRAKAVELGLSDATTFYNCNGLPVFADSVSTAKMQNHMSAADLFTLSSYLLSVYPQITEITSKKSAALPTLKMDIKNTNALLFNMEGATGLKTGTTNMAGACVVESCHIESAGGPHDLVSIVLGAEDNTVRFTSGEVLLRYAKQELLSGGDDGQDQNTGELPSDAEGIVRMVLSYRS